MANIDDPKHAHYMPPLTAGEELDPKNPAFHKAIKLHGSGNIKFTVASAPTRTENPDGSVTDTVSIARTYTPSK